MKDLNLDGDELVNQIGFSVHHPNFKQILTKLKHELPVAKMRTNINLLQIDKIWNDDFGIYLDFTTSIGYFNCTGIESGPPFTQDKYELILNEVNFSDEAKHEINYPFTLIRGDSHDTISKK